MTEITNPHDDLENLDFLFVHSEAGIFPFMLSINFPPLGLMELSSYLNAKGFRTRVVDGRHEDFTLEWLADFIVSYRPRWVGISVLTDNIFQSSRLVHLVRNYSPSTRIALGGAHATLDAEELLKELSPDAVVRGEGELPCVDLLTKSKLEDVKGISFLKGGEVVNNPPPPLLDLDSKPPPDVGVIIGFEAMDYHPSVNTGRGCPYRCSFCAAGTLSPTVRWRSVGKVMEDIEFMRSKCAGNYLAIFDDTFTVDIKRTEEFCRQIRRIGGGKDFFWYAEGRVDRLGGERALLKEMSESGLRFLQVGIESGDERVLNAYRKGIDLDEGIELCSACADEGILLHAGFIVGGPFESPETIEKTRDYAIRLAESSRGFLQTLFVFLNPLPGTEIFDEYEKFGIELLDPRLYTSTAFDNAVTATDSFSREDIFRQRQSLIKSSMNAMRETFLAQDEAFYDYLRGITESIGGPHHNSLRNLERKDAGTGFLKESLDKELVTTVNFILERADAFPQFMLSAKEFLMESIPARLPFFTVGEDGNYAILPDIPLTKPESDLFHFASGKLSTSEIAFILEKGPDEIAQVLESLERKKALIYRTY